MDIELILLLIALGIAAGCFFFAFQANNLANKRNKNKLARAKNETQLYKIAAESISDGIVVLDAHGEIAFVNETAKEALGVTQNDIDFGRYDESAATFNEKLQRENLMRIANASETAAGKERPERFAHAGRIWELNFAPLKIKSEEGEQNMGALCVMSDITEATKASEAQATFAANISHEIKTPLAVIKSYVETLLAGGLENKENAKEWLDIILAETDKMNELISEYLLTIRLGTDGTQIALERVDITALTKTVMRTLAEMVNKKGLVFNRIFSEDVELFANAHRNLLERALKNIISNAIRYTDEGGRIDIDLLHPENCIQIVISDSGVGISEEDLPRVFERFYTVDNARTRAVGGTGLGLAISRQIMEAHGGSIAIESTLGKGTTVTLTLPAEKTRGVSGIE